MITIKNYFPTTVLLDDDETGEVSPTAIRVKRLTVDEYTRFKADFNQCADPPSNRLIARKPVGDEQERDDVGLLRVSETQVVERRLFEMDAATRARYDDMLTAEEALADHFMKEVVRQYVTVPENEITWEGKPVLTGEDLISVYCSRVDIMRLLVRSVLQENTLSASQKKILKSLSTSLTSSSALLQAPAGPRPAVIVEPVASPVYVSAEAATASIGDPSGSVAA